MYDGDAILLEYDGANSLQARYAHGEEIDQPLAMTRGGRPSGRLTRRHRRHGPPELYGVDHLGSVRVVTDAAGAVANRYDYDAFGKLEATSYETVMNPFGFTARERDAESGLMFYRARYYDPEIGRFISEDPIGFAGEDLNLYRYIFNSPLNMIDPSGNFTVAEYVYIPLGVGVITGVAIGGWAYAVTGDGYFALIVGVGVAAGGAAGTLAAMFFAAAGASFGAGALGSSVVGSFFGVVASIYTAMECQGHL